MRSANQVESVEGVGGADVSAINQLDDIILLVSDWAERPETIRAFQDFFDAKSKSLTVKIDEDIDVDDGDNQELEWFTAFQEYEELFESQLTKLLDAEGLTPEAFVKWVAAAQDDSKESDQLIQVALGALDYEHFLQLMKNETKARKEAQEAADDLGF